MAELVSQLVPSMEMVLMVNSGTEATMSAIRLARGYTNRNKTLIEVEEIAAAALWLADPVSKSVNGQTIKIAAKKTQVCILA